MTGHSYLNYLQQGLKIQIDDLLSGQDEKILENIKQVCHKFQAKHFCILLFFSVFYG